MAQFVLQYGGHRIIPVVPLICRAEITAMCKINVSCIDQCYCHISKRNDVS